MSSSENAADAPYDLKRTPWPDEEEPPVSESLPSGFLPPSEVLGRYVVLYRLGTGGMGVVYAAYDPELDRKVALKLLRKASSNPKKRKRAQQRLLEEARAMARLAHPNVITVHDVQAIEGRVVVAMEFVDGQTLSAALMRGDLGWEDVLRRMLDAGRGLVAAHEAGIVHRDFKPDNVMLAKDGRVLVMDFGLARALDPELSSGGSSARMSMREVEAAQRLDSGVRELPVEAARKAKTRIVGTPAYMAPEQHRGRHVDGRTDQFSFCVTLWEAVYGHRPFHGESPKDMLRQVESGKLPDPPVGSKVPGWVRAVMVRGLSIEPDDRFPSMKALLEALGHDPRQGRRRYVVGAAAVVLVSLGGVGAYTLIERRTPVCAGGAERLEGVWDKGRRAQVEASFLASDKPYAKASWQAVQSALDDYAARWNAMHREVCEATQVRGEQSDELMDLRMECLGRRLRELEALTDVFSDADVALVQTGVGATGKLVPLSVCSDAELLKTPLDAPDDPETRVRIEEVRDQLARAKAHEDAGRYSRGLAIAKGALERAEGLAYPPLLAESLVQVGRLQLQSGMPETAEESFRRGVHAAALGHHDVMSAHAWLGLSQVAAAGTVRLARATEFLDAAKAAIERVGQPADLRAVYHNVRAVVLLNEGDGKRSEAAFLEALAAHRETAGDDDLGAARFLNNLAAAQMMQGKPEEGLRSVEEALAIEEHSLGGQHPMVAVMLVNLGAMQLELGDFDAAENALRRSVAIWEGADGFGQPELARALHNLAMAAHMRGDYVEAEKGLRRALEIFDRKQGEHPDEARTLFRLGACLREAGQPTAAKPVLDRAEQLATKLLGDAHPDVALIRAEKAGLQLDDGHARDAAATLAEVLPALEEQPMPGSDLAFVWWTYARALVGRDPALAREQATKARDAFAALPASHPWHARGDEVATWMAEQLPASP